MNKRSKIKIISVLLLIAAVMLVFLFGFIMDRNHTFKDETEAKQGNPHIELSRNEQTIPLVGDIIVEWTKGESTAIELYEKYSDHVRIYCSRPVVLQFSVFDIPNGERITSQVIELSDNPTFDSARKYDINSNKRSVTIDYLFVDTTYYYRLTATISDGTEISAVGQFHTADTPRILIIDGASNMRDVGGYKTTDGHRVKQGLLYRGTELDGSLDDKFILTQSGVEVMLEEFGIRTEIDLRSKDPLKTKDMLGESVQHRYYSLLVAYEKMFTDQGKKAMQRIFSDFALEETFPAYIHCSYGTDRTGMVCFFLQAILGVSQQDIYNEWELSVLYNGGAFYEEMNTFLDMFNALDGNTAQEKAENYLLSAGVTMQEIENIRKIFLED